MVTQFEAFLLLVVTILFIFIVVRVVQSDREAMRRSRRWSTRARGTQPPE